MRFSPAFHAASARARIHPALTSFADECRDTVVRILAYVGALALLGVIVFYAANPLTDAALGAATEPASRPGWSVASRSHPAFAVSQFDAPGKTAGYEILRHPDGGRKDVLRLAAPGEPPAVEIEIYRLGAERPALPPQADLAARMDPSGTATIQNAGVLDSKFGPVALFSLAGAASPAAGCLGFVKAVETAPLRLSGWTCQGDTGPQRRAAAACLLDRLVLLAAGGDPATADVFARAELRRGACPANQRGASAASGDWVTTLQEPRLRGGL